MDNRMKLTKSVLEKLGIERINFGACDGIWITQVRDNGKLRRCNGDLLPSCDPTTNEIIAYVIQAEAIEYEMVVTEAARAFLSWRMVPAPKRGEIVRQLGEELRKHKKELGALVSIEMGKILAEGEGEVQEMIDMCDKAAGMSRDLYGKTMHSERPEHFMMSQCHPYGIVSIITAFNFPIAVWAWNAALAAICGNTIIWKPSSETPLCAIAVQHICNQVMKQNGLSGIFNLLIGKGSDIGEKIINDERIPKISFTGSTKMGTHVEVSCAKRLAARRILELGGNNAVIVLDNVSDSIVFKLAQRAILFGSVGTAGQRCTTTRRLIMQKKVAPSLTEQLIKAYKQVKIGDPLVEDTLMGPLVNRQEVINMMTALEEIKRQGGEVLYGGKHIGDCFVEPALVRAPKNMPIMREETFAPILYLVEAENIEEAIEINNSVPQGLSSSLFTKDLASAMLFVSHRGSDCGIANINVGTSGAEIGGAFGGEKKTGGGREAGSDAWKEYMWEQTTTINWSNDLPLAQGIKFGND